MSAIAEAQGFTEGQDLLTVIAEGHHHAPQCWGHRLPEALEFLLGAP
ncbi:MAG TPA: hypothetical protein VL332_01930 [Candidatus Saccharimonadaceae bacterium]|jgi:hypothetical protein|nr:hypothetical protein [Candidatus Saccharimonadaceae bacterium]